MNIEVCNSTSLAATFALLLHTTKNCLFNCLMCNKRITSLAQELRVEATDQPGDCSPRYR